MFTETIQTDAAFDPAAMAAIIAEAQQALAAELASLGEAPAAPARPRKAKVQVDRVGALHEEAPEMTAGQKAAATRAAIEEARRAQAARRNGVEEPSHLEDAVAVELYVDDAKLGCGQRNFVVVEIGPKLVTLFYPATLATLKLDRVTFERDAKPYKTSNAKLLARIDAVIQSYEKSGLEYDAKAAKAAIRALIA